MKRVLRGAVFAALPTALLFGAFELGLRASGVEPPSADRLGFDEAGTYVAPDPEVAGGFRTHVYPDHLQEMETRIGPKGGELRVVLLGGSNTESFPESILEAELEKLDPGRGYEVINLGRQGYGSARVAILFEQALVLEPDLVVVYSGHNEFIELDFQLELAALENTSGPLRSALDHTAVFGWLEERVGDQAVWNSGEEPTALPEWSYDGSQSFTYDQTLERFAAYRRNLEVIFDLAREVEADLLVCTPIGNELAMPLAWEPPADFPAADRETYVHQRNAWMQRLPEPMSVFVPPTGRDRIKSFAWSIDVETELTLETAPRLRPLAPPFDQRPPYLHQPERLLPKLVELLEIQSRFFHEAPGPEEQAGLERFLADSQRFLDAVPDDPMVHFGRGLALYRQGRGPEAAGAFHRAAAFDRGPQAANDTSNAIVRELAAENPDVHLFDTAALYRGRCPDGIVGYELMRDECHLHTTAYRQLMRDLAPEVIRLAP